MFGIDTPSNCAGTPFSSFELTTRGNTVAQGQAASWTATAPAGLVIDGVTMVATVYEVNDGHQYGGGAYWLGGGWQAAAAGTYTTYSFGGPNGYPFKPSPYFAVNLVCGANPCTTNGPSITIAQATLDVAETTQPALLPSKLWTAGGWVRGDWPLSVDGDSPSGLCTISASVDAQIVASQSYPSDPAAWHQCNAAGAGGLNATVHTTQFLDGSHSLSASGSDAAGLTATAKTSINVDNTAPTVALSGPADVAVGSTPTTVTARASTGPSGLSGIDCTVDSGPDQHFASSPAQIPVNGVGVHTVSCTAQNNALDANGNRATSAPATTTVKIGTPTVAAIGFTSLVDGLRCHKVTETAHIPARWVTVLVKGRKVRVHERAHTQRIRITKCRVRTARRTITVWVKVRRHGRTVRVRRRKTVRVLLRPHRISRTTRLVAHGRGTTVDGWVGTTTGVALAGQPVQLYTAVADGSNQFVPVGTTTTRANGSWSARIGAGPSRLIKAVYPGEPTTESAESAPVTMVVPARVRLLRVSPARVPWGGTVRLTGRLVGGYLPPGGALVRLRIGLGRTFITYGVHEHVTGSGRFTTSYTFGAGQASVYRAYSFQLASLPMGNYPYAPAASNRLQVVVGGHPAPRRRPSRRTHRRG